MTDGETGTGVIYPPPAATNAKNWEPALLNACSSRRLQIIAWEFDLSGYSRLPKQELYEFIYDHMLTEQECTVCGGQCIPTEHLFQPLPQVQPLGQPQDLTWILGGKIPVQGRGAK